MAAGNAQVIYQRHVDIDRLLREYTPHLRKKIDPRDIYNELLDLTRGDRENIMCQTTVEGNIRGMDKLLECIARRPRSCFFDFLILLENNGYSEKYELIFNREGLINSTELSEARKRYKIRNSRDPVDTVHSQNVQGIVDDRRTHHLPLNMHNIPRLCNPVPYQMMPPATTNQPNIPYHAGSDQGIGSSNPPLLHPMQSAPFEMSRFDSNFRGNCHQSNIPGFPGQNVNTFHQNHGQFGQGGGRIPRSDNDSQIKSKDDFVIDLTGQFGSRQAVSVVYDRAAVNPIGQLPVSTSHYLQVKTDQNNGHQRVRTDHMDTSRMREGPNEDQSPLHNTAVMQTDRLVSVPHQQGAPENAQDDRVIDELTDEVFSKLVESLSNGGESPSWKKVGRKAKLTRREMKSIESDSSTRPAEVMLNILIDKYGMTIKKLGDILRQTGCVEALQILEGTVGLHRNIEVSDDENVKINNLDHLEGRYPQPKDETSSDLNTKSSENTGSFPEEQSLEKVIENISAPFCREPQEHEHLKCEAHQEIFPTMSEDCSKDMKSVQPSEVIPSGDENQNQGERTVEPIEAVTDQENKNTRMDVVGLAEDISANLKEGNVVDEAIPNVSTVSIMSNKMQNSSFDSTQDNVREEFPAELSGVQAQGDANISHSEKPTCQELVQLQREIQTQPNMSSFRDLQHSIPANQREGVSPLSVSGRDQGMDVVGPAGDISANSTEGNVVDEAMPNVSTVSVISNKMQNLSFDSTQDNEREEFPAELSGVQAQGDANISHSEKPPCQELVQLQREIQTQPNMSSFRDLQHSIPAHQREGVSPLSVLGRGDQGLVGNTKSDRQSFQNEHEKDVKHADMSLECSAVDKSILLKNTISENVFTHEQQLIQPNPGFASQEMSVSEVGDGESFFNNKAVFDNHTASMNNRDVSTFKAEGDANCKQSALPPNMDHKNFQRDIETQQRTSEDCGEQTQQNNSTTADPQAPRRETEYSLHTGSFRDVQNSVPEYRSQDLENPNSSLPRNVDSLVMDEEETFLKEENRPL
ncbi:uncharacterized protein LOC110463473 [Mizuhopecten yessoensis]|uniref:Death domain-containing protein n=1 Tax=Mizuhopecten yessoensis TaxID=6573 RepID=A0A210PW00_MIZYE|nr:uncharacterized protein LOC110463473 [Mizuhopecten yessoensis]OWF40671.1 hypothetical protein KP79_PYT19196 [Mizuhopecten yessoensis]